MSIAPLPGLTLPLPLAVSIVAAFIALAIYAVRAHGRRSRRRARRRQREFARLLGRLLDGRTRPEAVRRIAAEMSQAEFWAVLERSSQRWRRRDWMRVSVALEHHPFVKQERRALLDESPWRRELAARYLSLVASRASRRALRRGLSRGPEMVSLACARSLARYRDLAALRWILDHPGVLARRPRNVLAALFRSFGRKGGPVLAAALEQEFEHPHVECAVIDAVGRMHERSARAAIERRLRSPILDARIAACRALGEMQAVESGTSLLAALRDDAWQVRAQAARALGRARVMIALHTLPSKLSDPSWWVRRHSAYALGEMGHEGQSALRHIVDSSNDPYARDMAREVLEGGVRFDAA